MFSSDAVNGTQKSNGIWNILEGGTNSIAGSDSYLSSDESGMAVTASAIPSSGVSKLYDLNNQGGVLKNTII